MNEHNLAKQSDKDKQNSDYLDLVELDEGTEHQTKNRSINKDESKFLSRALVAQKEMT
ncbi:MULTISPECIES: hypothetical protein [unclassified Acinetobacter]|uniref:hypothetical protein n=1 Tax=unclassified Acinetobacter TaxID=196816 RepID=UPI00244AF711|nr:MULTISPECIES: hypothetical protein [unclassified Acinetobacter]MDH0031360.1 hypothetical protein [Acinetobacter sp. GD04021]MDH0887155.1 hypothetical protein [Acinetobacter sp. GD03873]MDH1083556.1 hypothetical protein [Acinetobacter sp. GD03983]MDH2190471.1 hypothetical protein [Acinetobacter sp. GD03645]MDH2204083.1 hypothetical protein [Acinetobacter sp. GD03647]